MSSPPSRACTKAVSLMECQPLEDNDGVRLEGFDELSIADEKPADVNTSASGAYSTDLSKENTPKGFSPSSNPYKPPFVLKGSQALGDDPFASPPRRTDSQFKLASQRTPTGPRHKRGIDSENWRSGSSSGSDTGLTTPSRHNVFDDELDTDKSPSKTFLVQEYASQSLESNCTEYRSIKDEESQSIFPPSCCVFVANLLQSESEEALQVAVTQVFREYGSVYVKIRRDGKQMPFAFCQYTAPEHAERAIREGRGRLIKGRPCRCEKAKAHRLFYVERKYGAVVTPEEARELLESFGTITLCHTASTVERTALNLNEGVVVEFELYDEGQAAFAAFRNHDTYKIHAVAGLGTSPTRNMKTSGPSSSDREYLDRYEVDRRSIFVGNLAVGTEEAQVAQLFEPYGTIQQIAIREAASRFDSQEKFCFAFVEFTSPMAVTRAISGKHGFQYGGKSLRVSQKDADAAAKKRGGHDRVDSTDSFRSPPRQTTQPPISPVAQVSPSVFGYGQFSPIYASPGAAALYTDCNGQYYATAPPTAYGSPYGAMYSYPGSPAYTTNAPPPSATSGSPNSYPAYYYYGGYPTPAPTYGMYPQAQQSFPTGASHDQGYSTTTQVHDDRSMTPTPASHSTTAKSTLESQ